VNAGLTADPGAARAQVAGVGVWSIDLAMAPAASARRAAARVEELGYASIWFGEGPHSREALVNAGLLLSATERVSVATGIANLYARDAGAMVAGALGLGEAYPGRFVLGIGVSHPVNVEPRGHGYGRPLSAMGDYLDRMAEVEFAAAAPLRPVPVVLAALRARMLGLAAERTAGAHSYFVPVAHTARARAALGAGPALAVELAVALEEEPVRARRAARAHMAWYLGQPNYVNNLAELGYGEDEVAGGGSDRLVDDLVAWGNPEAVRARVAAHFDAGADAVLLQPLADDLDAGLGALAELAPLVTPLGRAG
jgi:probable F420-dependent oxidoreductase